MKRCALWAASSAQPKETIGRSTIFGFSRNASSGSPQLPPLKEARPLWHAHRERPQRAARAGAGRIRPAEQLVLNIGPHRHDRSARHRIAIVIERGGKEVEHRIDRVIIVVFGDAGGLMGVVIVAVEIPPDVMDFLLIGGAVSYGRANC